MIRVVLADDHQVVLAGFRLLLKEEPDIYVVGEANDGRQVIEMLENPKITPIHVAVLDISMPLDSRIKDNTKENGGIETAKIIKEKFPEVKVLILSMHKEPAYLSELINLDIEGYILKEKGKEEFTEAIRYIAKGKKYFSRDTAELILELYKSEGKNKKEDEYIKFTTREEEVLKLIAVGLSTPEISEKLHIAPPTVETHRRNVIDKTKVKNSKELIVWAIKNGYAN